MPVRASMIDQYTLIEQSPLVQYSKFCKAQICVNHQFHMTEFFILQCYLLLSCVTLHDHIIAEHEIKWEKCQDIISEDN